MNIDEFNASLTGFTVHDISEEVYREYHDGIGGTIRIENPKFLYIKGDIHRVLDASGAVTRIDTKIYDVIKWRCHSTPFQF